MATFQESDIAFVTGAGSGIGRATCRLLAERGATVVATDINKPSADETVKHLRVCHSQHHHSIELDVTKRECVIAAIHEVTSKYSSPPNIIVNCAGVILFQPLLDLNEDTFDRFFDINVKGTFWVTQAACRALIANKKEGSIINIASIAKHGMSHMSLYGATKGAVDSFSLAAAREFGPHGIRVNSVSPGCIDTPLMVTPSFEEALAFYSKINPLRRIGKPEEIAEVICFLASSMSSYVNGSPLYVHGGQP